MTIIVNKTHIKFVLDKEVSGYVDAVEYNDPE